MPRHHYHAHPLRPPASLRTTTRPPYQVEYHDCEVEDEEPPDQTQRAPPSRPSTSPSSITAVVDELVEAEAEGWGSCVAASARSNIMIKPIKVIAFFNACMLVHDPQLILMPNPH